MCGISGFLDFNKSSSIEILEQMNNSMVHRGPDGSGSFFEESENLQIGLGHRRLSIIDIDGSPQPMSFQNFTVTFNGEIYNFQEIKSELESLGHIFNTSGDTEVILQAYAEWGIQCVGRFVGMFAIVIFDRNKEELICIRDRAGIKPFYYYWHRDLFLFCSELKAIISHPKFEKQLNLNAVSAYINYGYIPTPNCIYTNCFKLEPGHYLKFSFINKSYNIVKYWDVNDAYNVPKLDVSYNEALVQTENILTKAFNYRMVSDVPVGVFLSGGYDSSLVTAILQKNSKNKLNTFTVGVGEPKLNEAPFARQVSDYIGTNHNERYCTEKDALEIIQQIPFHFDEPYGDSSAIPTMLVSQLAAKQVKVALSADAGDEIFAGYYRYEYIQKLKFIDSIPSIGKKSMSLGMSMAIKTKLDRVLRHPLASQRMIKLKKMFDDNSVQAIMENFAGQFESNDLSKLMVHKSKKLGSYFDTNIDDMNDKLSGMMAIDYKTYLLDDILTKVDRATMSQSIEGREPFLDHTVIEWAAQLPNHFKYHKGNKKRILKDITHQYIPKNIMDRPKMGFAIPINRWMRDFLLPQYSFLFEKNYIQNQGLFHYDEMQRILLNFKSGNDIMGLKVWHLLTFQMWYNRWMS